MGFLGNVLNTLNPIKLLTDSVGGWLGNITRIATTVIAGLATGRPISEILKDVVKDVVALAIKMAITTFTGGTAGLFINTLVDKMQGVLGQVAAKVLTSGLSKPLAEMAAKSIEGFAGSLTSDAVRSQISSVVLSAAGLPNEQATLDPKSLDLGRLSSGLSQVLNQDIDTNAAKWGGAPSRFGKDEFVTRA
jgi:hypothetical protein